MKSSNTPKGIIDICHTNVARILNKMTLEKFEALYKELKEVGINDLESLDGVIRLVFDKAVTEHHFCTLYANLCFRLAADIPSFPSEDGSQQVSDSCLD